MTRALPPSIRLTGGDYFVCAIDRQMRRAGQRGNVCRLVLRLEGALDEARLRERLAASVACGWISRLRLTRLLPLLPPRWRTSGAAHPGIALSAGQDRSDPASPLPGSLPDPDLCAGRSPALALDLLHGTDGASHLVLSWHHALMDARGAELLLRHLLQDAAPTPDPRALLLNPAQTGSVGWRPWRSFPTRLNFARESLAVITSTCREPFFSLLPASPAAPPRRNEYRVCWLSAAATARVDAHCRLLNAGFRRSHFYLAASIRALHAVAVLRGAGGGAYVVPVPHDLRKRGATSPVLSNQISFLFFRIEASQAAVLPVVILELSRQMRDQIGNRTPDSFLASMELFTPIPLGLYLRQILCPTQGKFVTFIFSDAGESFPDLHETLGARTTAVTHLAPASHPPGLTVVFSRFRGRLCFVISWVDDCLTAREIDLLEHGVRDALTGEEFR
jgi:hypothetical protein